MSLFQKGKHDYDVQNYMTEKTAAGTKVIYSCKNCDSKISGIMLMPEQVLHNLPDQYAYGCTGNAAKQSPSLIAKRSTSNFNSNTILDNLNLIIVDIYTYIFGPWIATFDDGDNKASIKNVIGLKTIMLNIPQEEKPIKKKIPLLKTLF